MEELLERVESLKDLHRSGQEPYPVRELIGGLIIAVELLTEQLGWSRDQIGSLEGQLSDLEINLHREGIHTGRDS